MTLARKKPGVLVVEPEDNIARAPDFILSRKGYGHARISDGNAALPQARFLRLIAGYPVFKRFFHRGRQHKPREAEISCLAVVQDARPVGIVTARDFTDNVLVVGVGASSPVSAVMAADPLVLLPELEIVPVQDEVLPLRPRTCAMPIRMRFKALGHRQTMTHPQAPSLRPGPLYSVARWKLMQEALVAVDCAANRRVLMTEGVKITPEGTLTGAEWEVAVVGDKLQKAACREG